MKKLIVIALIGSCFSTGCFYLNPMGAIDKKLSEAETRINDNFAKELKTEIQNAMMYTTTLPYTR